MRPGGADTAGEPPGRTGADAAGEPPGRTGADAAGEPPGRAGADTAGEPPGGDVARRAGSLAEPVTGPVVRQPGGEVDRPSQAVAPSQAPAATPSWGQVASTTLQLWMQRRSRRWRAVMALILLIAVFAAGALTVALIRQPGSGAAASGGAGQAAGSAPVAAATAARQRAASWISAQVSHSTVVSCDPAMCATLEARGFPSGNLMTIGSSAGYPLGSAVIVSTSAVRSEFGSRLTTVYAPTVLASFGAGPAQVDVRAYAPDGAAAYLSALRTDQAARRSAGSQLLRNHRVEVASAARTPLAAGQVDARLLITIATLAAQGRVSIVAFGDSGPGASPSVPFRAAELSQPSGTSRGYLQSVLTFLRAQQAPYLANSISLAQLANGQDIVRIEYAAPSPLGLLSG